MGLTNFPLPQLYKNTMLANNHLLHVTTKAIQKQAKDDNSVVVFV